MSYTVRNIEELITLFEDEYHWLLLPILESFMRVSL